MKDGHGEEFHTTVTVFQPDVERDGEIFDYSVYLAGQSGNYELEVIEKSPTSETAYGEMLATDSKGGLSTDTISQSDPNVNKKFSYSSIANSFFDDETLATEEFLNRDYHETEFYN